MKVSEVMTKKVKWAEIPGTRESALELLKELDVSAVPVLKSETGEFVGMITLRRLLDHPDEDQLAMLVDREVPTVSPSQDLKECAQIMLGRRLRRLPVVEGRKLVGVITVRDIVYRVLIQGFEVPASNFMSSSTVAIWEGTPLRATLEIMSLAGLRALPVIDSSGNLVGMVDDSDIVKVCELETSSRMSQMAGRTEGDSWTWDTEDRIYITKRILSVPEKAVREVMTTQLITIDRKTSVSESARLMKEHRIEQLPVVSAEGRFVGIVYDMDLLKVL
ncbi:MAG: CBS domain-containing protein [Candidatus Hadarchaeales archaeon]